MTLRCGTLPGSTPSHPPGGVHTLRPARCHDNQPPKRVLSGITAGQGGGHRLPSRHTPVPKRHSASGWLRVLRWFFRHRRERKPCASPAGGHLGVAAKQLKIPDADSGRIRTPGQLRRGPLRSPGSKRGGRPDQAGPSPRCSEMKACTSAAHASPRCPGLVDRY